MGIGQELLQFAEVYYHSELGIELEITPPYNDNRKTQNRFQNTYLLVVTHSYQSIATL